MALTRPPTTGLPAALLEAQWGSAVNCDVLVHVKHRDCRPHPYSSLARPPHQRTATPTTFHLLRQNQRAASTLSHIPRLCVSCGGLPGLTTAWTHPAHPQRRRPPVPMSESHV